MLEVGSVVDRKYKILSEVGHGGMSVVYLAINERANKTWAIKEVRKDGSNNFEVVKQGLIAETEILKKLNHKYLPSIIDVIDREDSFLIVMDYIEGKSLEKILEHNGAQDKATVIEWAKQLCEVLEYLHTRTPPIIYRDMKPANVMLRPDGTVCLIDFGTAREHKDYSLQDTTYLGTRGYAAPEQFGGMGQTDARTDVYNLGATIYHLLTGYSPAQTQFVIRPLGELNPYYAGSGIEAIVAKCCKPEQGDRYQSCAELLYELEHEEDGSQAAIRKRNRQWGAFIACIVAFFLTAVGAVGFKVAASNASNQSYDYYVDMAAGADSDLATSKANFQKAMDLQPSNPDAYEQILEYIKNDSKFTQEEKVMLDSCIKNTNGGLQTNLDMLQARNPQAYDQFIYNLGYQYYFFYTGSDRRRLAANEFSKVLDSTYLSSSEIALADSLYTIGSAALDDPRSDFTYRNFWDKMVELTDGDLNVKLQNPNTAVDLYKEMVYQIYTNTNNFKAYGVTREEMDEQLEKVDEGLNQLTDNFSMEYLIEQSDSTHALIVNARQIVATTYTSIG